MLPAVDPRAVKELLVPIDVALPRFWHGHARAAAQTCRGAFQPRVVHAPIPVDLGFQRLWRRLVALTCANTTHSLALGAYHARSKHGTRRNSTAKQYPLEHGKLFKRELGENVE